MCQIFNMSTRQTKWMINWGLLTWYLLIYFQLGQYGGRHERLCLRHQRRRPSFGSGWGGPTDGQPRRNQGTDENVLFLFNVNLILHFERIYVIIAKIWSQVLVSTDREVESRADRTRGSPSLLQRGTLVRFVPAKALHETELPVGQSTLLRLDVAKLLFQCNCEGRGRSDH